MESPKFTEGDWYYDPEDKFNPDRAGRIVRKLGPIFDEETGTEGATEIIAEILTGPTAEADARVMAASKELYEALRPFADLLEDPDNYEGPGLTDEDGLTELFVNVRDIARAKRALDKAERESDVQ